MTQRELNRAHARNFVRPYFAPPEIVIAVQTVARLLDSALHVRFISKDERCVTNIVIKKDQLCSAKKTAHRIDSLIRGSPPFANGYEIYHIDPHP